MRKRRIHQVDKRKPHLPNRRTAFASLTKEISQSYTLVTLHVHVHVHVVCEAN